MAKILITGCSSGFGLETAKFFLERGWNVAATMRTPNAELLPSSDRLQVLPLDVTDAASISRAVAEAGPIDVLVNNAAFGVPSPVELVDPSTVRTLFETNTLGTLAMMQAVLPSFRERRSGVIINVTSSVTLRPLPLIGLYRASKAAVNAFTETLALEVKPFGVARAPCVAGTCSRDQVRRQCLPASARPRQPRLRAHDREGHRRPARYFRPGNVLRRCLRSDLEGSNRPFFSPARRGGR